MTEHEKEEHTVIVTWTIDSGKTTPKMLDGLTEKTSSLVYNHLAGFGLQVPTTAKLLKTIKKTERVG
jgi:hypothetical protein